MPLIDSNGYLKDVLYWEDLIGTEYEVPIKSINLPVVIMAGGIGTRLKPLTNVIPKPLIPLGEKTMIEIIIDSYAKYNCKDFYISVNYKADILKFYLDSVIDKSISIHYFQEDMPLGTAGSLTLIKDKINTTFFVSNCDIIIKNDYEEILKYHRENNNELTIVAAVKDFSIPYGTIELSNNGLLKSMTEKPSFHFLINSGMYILEPHLLKEIPTNEFYHITYLIDRLLKEDRRVGVFPVSEKSWIDIGDWKEYMKQLNLS
jgi:NDP-sugar pyrophosphorylase family protein